MPDIYFHVGMGKVASTYLQYDVFPKFTGVHYIQRTKYKRAKEIIAKGSHDKYFISREFDQQMEAEAKDFSAEYPDAKPIIIFRRHGSWIASQHRRFVKNGNPWEFDEFIDLEKDTGRVKKQDLEFFRNIEILEKYFNHKPLVLFYEDLRADTIAFSRRIADYMGADFDPKDINLEKRHTSYNEKQLRAIYGVSKSVNIRKHRDFKIGIFNQIRRALVNPIKYGTLYIAPYLPESMLRQEPLVRKEQIDHITELYTDDWEKLKAYAKKFNRV
ncbi:MAG: hypothetical protein AAF242_07635 [Bacteroidota bacterium]